MNYHCLHGFLGSGQDFEFIKSGISLFGKNPEISWNCSLENFGKRFNDYVRTISSVDNILIGYSLGGRLAMHALLAEESLYKAAVIVSSHTGLTSTLEKQKRLQQDKQLAQKLKECSFKTFTDEWDKLPLFKGSPPMKRDEAHYDKEALSHSLTEWSLGKQEFLPIEKLSLPLLFIAGELDPTYREIAQNLQLKNQKSRVWIAKESTHRVPWQSQKKFIDEVECFIISL